MQKPWGTVLALWSVAVWAGGIQAGQEIRDSLIRTALRNHPEFAAATHLQSASEHRARGAGALPDPGVSLAVLNVPTDTWSLKETPMSGVSLGLSQRIPWPGKIRARSEWASAVQRQSQAASETIKNRIIREVTIAYLDYSHAVQSGRTIDKYLDLLAATLHVTEERYAHGDASAQDLLRTSSLRSRAEVRRLDSEQMRRSAWLRLWRAVGDSLVLDNLPDWLPEARGYSLGESDFDANPQLRGAALSVRKSEAQERLAKSQYWPDITLGVDYRFRHELPSDPVRGADFFSFKVGLNVPLWFFTKQKHQVQAARRQALASQEQERAVRELIGVQLEDAYSVLAFTVESMQSYDEAIVPQAEAAAEAAQVAYQVGQIDFNALLSAQADLLEVRLERIDLLRRHHLTRAKIAELLGSEFKG
jgi:outer membrane protein TolC